MEVNLLYAITELLRNIELALWLFVFVGIPISLYLTLMITCRHVGAYLYERGEARKRQKEYDKMITEHEERYHKK
jgi:hypothetical protein